MMLKYTVIHNYNLLSVFIILCNMFWPAGSSSGNVGGREHWKLIVTVSSIKRRNEISFLHSGQ